MATKKSMVMIGLGEPSAEEAGAEGDDLSTVVAEDVLDAIKRRDAEGLADSLRELIRLCTEESTTESEE